jgi:hypothetical protein
LLEPLRQSLFEKYGFDTDLDHFALFGVCPECREARGKELEPVMNIGPVDKRIEHQK